MSPALVAPDTGPPESTPSPTLVVLAAGLSTRYGAVKPLASVGPQGEALIDYALYDAACSGYGDAILMVRQEIEAEVSRHVEKLTGGSWPCRFVCQRMDDLPDGVAFAGGRAKPWGTGHAVWTARHAVRGPFTVVNADDFYGRAALQPLAEHLLVGGARENRGPQDYVAITYRLADTLSDAAPVSRAILQVDADHQVREIREVLRVHRTSAGIVGETPDGVVLSFSGDEPSSMGIWGFKPTLFPLLEDRLRSFLGRPGADDSAEFYLSDTLNGLIASGDARIRAVESGASGFGVTFPDDRSEVRARIDRLVAEGAYPADLRSAFRALTNPGGPSGT